MLETSFVNSFKLRVGIFVFNGFNPGHKVDFVKSRFEVVKLEKFFMKKITGNLGNALKKTPELSFKQIGCFQF